MQGDAPEYSKPDFDDSRWENIAINNPWENQGYTEYDGYAWYRIKLTIPSSLKNTGYPADSLKFDLGKIDEFDQVYLNGFIIGQNASSLAYGSVPDISLEDTLSFSKETRKYVLSTTDKRIKWDQENVIAIRVFDPYDSGGLYPGIPYVGMLSLEDHLYIDKENFYKLKSIHDIQLETDLNLRNRSSKSTFSGELNILAENIQTKQKVLDENYQVHLDPGAKISFPVDLPVTTDQLKVYFTYRDDKLRIQVHDTDTIPYVLLK